MSTKLASVSNAPTQHPRCCLSLSTTLLTYLTLLITEVSSRYEGPTTTLSIGSGTGILEALLSQHLNSLLTEDINVIRVEGVEVHASSAVNKYLPGDAVHVMHGTWDICQRAGDGDVRVWMFVYPRKVELVERYVDRFLCEQDVVEKGEGVQMIVWAGPRSDMEDYMDVFDRLEHIGWTRETKAGEEVGLKQWESIIVLRRSRVPASQ